MSTGGVGSAKALACLAAFLLAGCAAPSTAPYAPVGSDAPPSVEHLNGPPALTAMDFEATECRGAALVVLREIGLVQRSLPAGYHARDASQLVYVPPASGQGAFLIAWLECAGVSSGTTGLILGQISAFVDPPGNDVEASEYLHFVVLDGWADWPGLQANATAWGTPWDNATAALDVLHDGRVQIPPATPTRPEDPGPGAATMSVTSPASGALEATLAGATGYNLNSTGVRLLRVGEAGTTTIDMHLDEDGISGVATCTYGADSIYAEWTEEMSCGDAPIIALIIPSFAMEGRAWLAP